MATLDVDYGNDIDCVGDLTFAMGTVDGSTMMAQSIARRLTTSRAGLFYSPEYGYNLRQFLSAVEPSISALNGAVENEVLKDPRVYDVDVSAEFNASTKTASVSVVGHGSEGPFDLTVLVSEISVELLREGNA